MANLRTGKIGQYYGSYYGESEYLSTEEQRLNAWYIRDYLYAHGWTIEAICGIVANMEHESTLNPGIWQGNDVGDTKGGYGLVQWTPATKYFNWCESEDRTDASIMDNNLDRVLYEVDHNIQYISTSGYPESFKEFTKSTKTPYYLACAFAWNYERSAVVLYGAGSKEKAEELTEAEKEANREALRQRRGGSANKWYEFFTGTIPPVRPTKRRKMPLWMYLNYT